MHSFMTGGVPLDDGCFGESVVLQGSEHLQVHMDCLNAHGQLVGIEDVDDMGGQVVLYVERRYLCHDACYCMTKHCFCGPVIIFLFSCSAGLTSESQSMASLESTARRLMLLLMEIPSCSLPSFRSWQKTVVALLRSNLGLSLCSHTCKTLFV